MSARTAPSAGASVGRVGSGSAWATVKRGLSLSPQIREGLPVTLLLALAATGGRVVVPVAVQQTIDRGFGAETDSGVDTTFVSTMVAVGLVAVLLTALAAFAMNARLFRASEAGLASLRVTAFRHVHDLSVQTQNSERRGGLVSRVTSDVDALSLFLQWAGVFLIVATGQIVLASVVMLVYSWQLALVVWTSFLPLAFAIRALQKHLAAAYLRVRERVGVMLGAISESVVGAEVVRAYGIEQRTGERIDTAIQATGPPPCAPRHSRSGPSPWASSSRVWPTRPLSSWVCFWGWPATSLRASWWPSCSSSRCSCSRCSWVPRC